MTSTPPGQDGIGFYQLTQRQGYRSSAADTYLRPALRRGNLTVETSTLTAKILVKGTRAPGVRYLRDGAERRRRGPAARCCCAAARSTAPSC